MIYNTNSFFYQISFLDASSHLYNRGCPSVRRSVRPSVRPSVRWSVTLSSKTREINIFEQNIIMGGTLGPLDASSQLSYLANLSRKTPQNTDYPPISPDYLRFGFILATNRAILLIPTDRPTYPIDLTMNHEPTGRPTDHPAKTIIMSSRLTDRPTGRSPDK